MTTRRWLACRRAFGPYPALAAGAVFLLCMPGARAVQPPPVQSALAALKQGGSALASRWRYQETITGSRGKIRLDYDPARKAGARWKVVSVNGKPPDEAARKRLAEQIRKRAGTSGRTLEVGSGWLAESHYQLIRKTAKTLVYQLRPNAGAEPDKATAALLGHLSGELVVARGDNRPLSLRLDNFESFSPRFGVKVEAFGFRATFKRLSRSGPIVVAQTSNFARGKVFWIKGFKDKTKVVLSDFAPVASSAPVAQTGGTRD